MPKKMFNLEFHESREAYAVYYKYAQQIAHG